MLHASIFHLFIVPEDFDYNPTTGRHGDRSHRTELKRSSVEYIAPSEYMVCVCVCVYVCVYTCVCVCNIK